MRVDLFDFDLPEEPHCAASGGSARCGQAAGGAAGRGAFADRAVRDLPSLLDPGDVLVFNDTKVIPAQLLGDAPARRRRRACRRDAAHARCAGPMAGLRAAGQTPGASAIASASAMAAMPAFSARSTRLCSKSARRGEVLLALRPGRAAARRGAARSRPYAAAALYRARSARTMRATKSTTRPSMRRGGRSGGADRRPAFHPRAVCRAGRARASSVAS